MTWPRLSNRKLLVRGAKLAMAMLAFVVCTTARTRAAPLPPDIVLPLAKVDTAGPFKIEVRRAVRDSLEVRLLQIAEETAPDADSLLAAARRWAARVRWPAPPVETLRRDGWWYTEFDSIRVPFAITRSAVEYYLGLIHGWKSTNVQSGFTWKVGSIRYRADIERGRGGGSLRRRSERTYVVNLHLEWTSLCGPTCGLAFIKQRTVELTPDGIVVSVKGDGATDFIEF